MDLLNSVSPQNSFVGILQRPCLLSELNLEEIPFQHFEPSPFVMSMYTSADNGRGPFHNSRTALKCAGDIGNLQEIPMMDFAERICTFGDFYKKFEAFF